MSTENNSTENKIIEISATETTSSENKNTEKESTAKPKKSFFKNLLDNVTENVMEGASYVGEKVAVAGGKVAETSAKAYVAGSELVSETSDKIHDYTEKQTLLKEEAKLQKRQIQLKHNFGVISFDHYLENGTLHKPFLTSSNIVEIVEEFEANKNRLLAILKELEELENH